MTLEPGRSAGAPRSGARRESAGSIGNWRPTRIAPFNQGHREAAPGGFAGNPCSGSPATDYPKVAAAGGENPNGRTSGRVHRLPISPTVPELGFEQRPSYWFSAHSALMRRGTRVLDLACGAGRHALAAAQLGAQVVAVDRDPAKIREGRDAAKGFGLSVEWVEADLERTWPHLGQFDVVLLFNYLDRLRMPQVTQLVGPGGVLIFETYLEIQRQLGWGPQQEAHLLKFGEISGLVAPLAMVHGREAFEPADNAQWAAMASVLARNPK